MALHRKVTDDSPIDLNPLYSQRAEEGHAPRHTLPMSRTNWSATSSCSTATRGSTSPRS